MSPDDRCAGTGLHLCVRGRSSMVERQPSKLNVDGSSPFARFLLTIPCQIYGESLRDACSGLNLKDRR